MLLIVDSDPEFAGRLLELAHTAGMKGLIALSGTAALVLSKKFSPAAITLDVNLDDMDGWAVLDLLKHDMERRHIPVHIVSHYRPMRRGLLSGAIGSIRKKAADAELLGVLNYIKGINGSPQRRVLIVEDQDIQREYLISLIGGNEVESVGVSTGKEALRALTGEAFDCAIIDLTLPDMHGAALLRTLRRRKGRQIPVVVYTAKELTKKEHRDLKMLAESVITKDASSPARLVNETALLLHLPVAGLQPDKQDLIRQLRHNDPLLAGKRVLIVDDDIRNIFSLTCVLEDQDMEVTYAENGKDAVEALRQVPNVDVVLMDVMMPDMDGYDTMRAIRKIERFSSLPMIAITAKAMKGDREKCIEAGASDYMAKPLDIMQLLSLLRVWLHRKEM